jgi:hypothetical protein
MKPTSNMPRQAVADFRADAISSGRYDLMALEYAYPLTIFIDGKARVADDPDTVQSFYADFHSAMKAEGYDRLTAKVTAEDMPRRGRFRIWTEWVAHGPMRASSSIAATVCYCSTVSGQVTTEMVEFSRLALTLLAA